MLYQPITNQNVTTSGTSAVITNATGTQIRILRLAATADTYIAIGAAPTATTSDLIIPAGTIDYINVPASTKVAGLQVSGAGVLSVTEMA